MNKIGATVGHLVGIDVEFYYRVWFKTLSTGFQSYSNGLEGILSNIFI